MENKIKIRQGVLTTGLASLVLALGSSKCEGLMSAPNPKFTETQRIEYIKKPFVNLTERQKDILAGTIFYSAPAILTLAGYLVQLYIREKYKIQNENHHP